MKARTLGYVIAACAPFWLLALVAILGRNYYSPYQENELGPEASQKILAYASPIRYHELKRIQIDQLEKKYLDEAAHRWIENFEAGRLESIEPISPEDVETTGFRNEIENNRKYIIVSLTRDLQALVQNQQFDEAAERASQILIICDIAKYNGPHATAFGAGVQRQVITHLDEMRPFLSVEAVNLVDEAIKNIEPDPERVKQTALRLTAIGNINPTKDAAVMPTSEEFKYMLTSNPHHYNVSTHANSSGVMLAESYRVAYQEEQRLENKIQLYGLTASKTNLEAKSDLP